MARKFERFLLLCLTLICFSLSTQPARADLNKQRQVFLDAESAFGKGDYAKFKNLSASLKEYPLYPYLVFMDIRKSMGLGKEKEILSFMNEWDGVPSFQAVEAVLAGLPCP